MMATAARPTQRGVGAGSVATKRLPTKATVLGLERLVKRPRRQAEVDFCARGSLNAFYLQLIEGFDGAFGLAHHGAERGEVVRADQHCRRMVHRIDIKRPLAPPGALSVEGERRRPVVDAIKVMPGPGRKPGVEVVIDPFCRHHRYQFLVHHQIGVDRFAHPYRIPITRQVDMRGLPDGMDAGVGAAGDL